MSLKKAVECVRKNNKFLITSHVGLEGDALGSELAFYLLLKRLGKAARVINDDKTPYAYQFLPHNSLIEKFSAKSSGMVDYDGFAGLDCAGLRRAGRARALDAGQGAVLNIDHHVSNQRFGAVNWVEPGYSSCSEMIYRLYKELRVPFDGDSALLLYTGILTDTGSFRYSNTTGYTHRAAAELLRFNLNVPYIYNTVYGNIPLQDMKFLNNILTKMRLEETGRLAWFQVEKKTLRSKQPVFDLTDHLMNYARTIKGVEVCALFRENLGAKDEVRVNLRSQGKIDVNKIAAFFGGGGHKTASGITIKGRINQVRRQVLDKIRESL